MNRAFSARNINVRKFREDKNYDSKGMISERLINKRKDITLIDKDKLKRVNLFCTSRNDFSNEGPFNNMKTKNFSQYENIILNSCPYGNECKNITIINKLKFEIKKLKMTINNISKVNENLIFTINQKDRMYKEMIKENSLIKAHLTKKIKKSKEKNLNTQRDEIIKEKLNTSSTINNHLLNFMSNVNIERFNNKSSITSRAKRQSMEQTIEVKSKEKLSQDFFYLKDKNIDNSLKLDHYDKIVSISNRTNNKKSQSTGGKSFLSLSINKLEEIANNPNLESLNNLTQTDDNFISKIRSQSNEFLINLCDIIRTLVKDYQQSIHLIQRVKLFLHSSIDLVKSILSDNSMNILLRNACSILECERASLFIYDDLSDQLIVHYGEGIKKNEIKVPKDKGIIGAVFMKGEKLKIDDAYNDPRFNQEVDKMTNYKTRNLLSFPLIDKDGYAFGVIQAINKYKKNFNHDDEELMLIFSLQASAILKNMMNIDANCLLISRLKLIIQYSIDIEKINSRIEFTMRTEELLTNLFSSIHAQVLFIKKDNLLYHYPDEKLIKQDNLGIVNYVVKKKECHGCKKVKKCKYYNALVDIPASESLITFPVIDNGKCVGVYQTVLNADLCNITNMPKDNDMVMLLMIEQCFKTWNAQHVDDVIEIS